MGNFLTEQFEQAKFDNTDKPFDKDEWLKHLANTIRDNTAKMAFTRFQSDEPINAITIEDLQEVLKYYFPQIKLTDYDRTPTNTGDNPPELASDTTATLRQPQDEDNTRTSVTGEQMVSS